MSKYIIQCICVIRILHVPRSVMVFMYTFVQIMVKSVENPLWAYVYTHREMLCKNVQSI